VTRLLIATRNAHKTREIQQILGDEFQVQDLSVHSEIPETPETGRTLEENAIIKVLAVAKEIPGLVMADDSGLEVDALDGAPGVYSARYAGKSASDTDNVNKLLAELAGQDVDANPRSARFRCFIALAWNGKLLRTVEGTIEGQIAEAPRGSAGFGYDPVFQPQGYDKTFAELSGDVKNRISHRAKAIEALRDVLSAADS
jgi:XTP/dITP diphosphohydrolase